jgi:hypothetical protein
VVIPRRVLFALLGGSFAALLIGACSAVTKTSTFGEGGGGETSVSSAGGAGGAGSQASASSSDAVSVGVSVSAGSGGGGPPIDDCSEAAKLIYVVGTTYELSSYHPPTKQFKSIGYINCPAGGASPFSMAVDRSGRAWVLHDNGQIFFVDTSTADCVPSGYQTNQSGFFTFGMGFVSDTPGSKEETLFVGNYLGQNLGKIDKTTLKLTPVGDYKGGLTGAAEITGTGDARLYGFFNNGVSTNVAQIDKNDATILSNAQPAGVTIGSGWAFAFWGGSFYLFTAPNGDSRVTKFTPDPNDPNTGTVNVEVPSVGFVIVGAGVSTCAPTEPPPS